MPTAVEITLRNMRFHVRVGILPHEAEFAQPLEIDLTVWASRRAPGDTPVDYRALHDIVTRAMAVPQLGYLEALAQQLVDDARALPRVLGARVAVRKPHVSLPGPLDCAEVVVEEGARS